MTKYGVSPWVGRMPKTRVRAYPRLRGPVDTDVVILGGGLTGCAVAYACAAAGVTAALVEADRVGGGASGSEAGWVSDDPAVSFSDVERAIGRRMARHAYDLWRRGALDFAALLRRLDITCGLEPAESATVALSRDQAAQLTKDRALRVDAGLDAPAMSGRVATAELGIDATAACRLRHGAVFDPYAATLGLAAAAAARGAAIYQQSVVTRIKVGRHGVDVSTDVGALHAAHVVVATGAPGALFHSLKRHVANERRYFVLTGRIPAAVRRQLGSGRAVVRDLATPSHLVRWVDGERLLIAGAPGAPVPAAARERTLVQRTGQLMYELSLLRPAISGIEAEYGWDAPVARSGDGLPYIGPHRNFPRHLFAWGDAGGGATGAYLSSRIVLRHLLGTTDAADAAFGFTRHGR